MSVTPRAAAAVIAYLFYRNGSLAGKELEFVRSREGAGMKINVFMSHLNEIDTHFVRQLKGTGRRMAT